MVEQLDSEIIPGINGQFVAGDAKEHQQLTLCSNYHLTMTYSIHYPMITWFTTLYLYFCSLQNSTKFHLYLVSSSVYDVPPGESYDVPPLFPLQELHVLCLLFLIWELRVVHLWYSTLLMIGWESRVVHLWYSTLLMIGWE